MKQLFVSLLFLINYSVLGMDTKSKIDNAKKWYIELIRIGARNGEKDFKEAHQYLKKTVTDQKHAIINEDAKRILKIYELLDDQGCAKPEVQQYMATLESQKSKK
ncbi:hypothetical protein HYX58_05615 [Candidatus Dependentiae bacterium]|nr:hypothetical protein [Candidatus Dependentiae bacterium]